MNKFLFLLSLIGAILSAQTNISISTTPVQANTKRVGVNLGGHAPYGSNQILRDIFATNPGFNNSIVSSMVSCDTAATTTTCGTSMYQTWTSGWWGSYTSNMRVMTGPAAGCTAQITNYTPNTFTFTTLGGNSPITSQACSTFSQSPVTTTNYIQVIKTITAANSSTSYQPARGWVTIGSGSSPAYSTVSDAPTNPINDGISTYTQSLDMSATGTDYAAIQSGADNLYLGSVVAGRNFLNLNGTYTFSIWAKSVSGTSPSLFVNVLRGGTSYYNHTFPLTATWTQYTGTFTASESGVQTSFLDLNLATAGTEEIRIQGAAVTENSAIGDNSAFRDAVVTRLKAMKPGIIRMWDGATGDTSPLNNMLVTEGARAPVNFNAGLAYPGYYNIISYSIGDFLRLAANVGTEAWITVPPTITPADASELVDYLAGSSSTVGGAIRAAQGQTAAWTTIVPHIYLELGNEQWNSGTFSGGEMAYNPPAYGALAQILFASMKSNSNWSSSTLSTVLGAQFQGTYYIQPIQNNCNNNDYIDVGPYIMNSVSDASDPNLWTSTLAEPQLLYAPVGAATCMDFNNYSSAASGYSQAQLACPTESKYSQTGSSGSVVDVVGGGIMSQNIQAEANSSHNTQMAFYETSVDGSGSEPGLTQAQLNSYLPSLGVGLMNANLELESMQRGINVQNIFQLGQDSFSNSNHYLIWGITEDIGGPTNGNRPTFWAASMINNAISTGGNMLTVSQSGTPTYSIGTPTNTFTPGTYSTYGNEGAINGVAGSNIQKVRSFAFANLAGTSYSLIMSNLSNTTQAVTFSGTVPSGSVAVTTLTSALPTDNNESTTTTVVPSTSTLSSPASYTLPAYSLVTMTWGSGGGGTPPATPCATYYVSNSGNDTANTGCTSGSPIQTIAFLNGLTMASGTAVLFQSGGTWSEQLNAQAGCSYGSYGTGAQPIIDGGSTRTMAISIPNPSGVTINNLHVRNATQFGIYATTSSNFSALIITANTIDHNGSNGIYILGSGSSVNSGTTINNNAVSYNGGSGIKLATTGFSGATFGGAGNTCLVQNNITDHNSQTPDTSKPDNVSMGEIYLVSPANQAAGVGCIISANTSSNGGVGASAVPSGQTIPISSYGNGIWADTVTSTKMLNNIAHDNISIGIYLEKTVTSIAYQNLAYNNATGGSSDFYANITLAAGPGVGGNYDSINNLVLENTAAGSGKAGFSFNFESSCCNITGNTIQDNIFVNSSYSFLASSQVNASGFDNQSSTAVKNVLTHNNWGATSTYYFNGTLYSSITAFEAVWGVSTSSVAGDPLFTNAGANNYTLQGGSPARAAGLAYSGYPAVCGGNPDLGYAPLACGAGTISLSGTLAMAGQSITLTSTSSVAWSLCSGCVGTLSTAGPSTSTVYTAPASLVASNDKGGCQVFPADSIWNANISNAPINSNSANWLSGWSAAVSTGTTTGEYDNWGTSIASASTPTRTFKTYYNTATYTGVPWPSGYLLNRQGGNYVGPVSNANSDNHTAIVRQSDCTFYEAYNDYLNGVTQNCNTGSPSGCNVQSIGEYSSTTYTAFSNQGTNAAGTPILTVWDAKAIVNNKIDYPTLFVAPLGAFKYGSLIWPASSTAGGCSMGACSNYMPMGAWFRVKASVSDSAVCGTGTTKATYCTTILEGLKNYGMVMSDTGSPNQVDIYFERDVSTNPTLLSAVQLATALPFADFEAIDVSSYQMASGSYQLCPNGSSCLSGTNSTLTPKNQAIINGNSIPLMGGAIWLGIDPIITMLTGSYTWQIPYKVIGNANTSATWVLSSGVGTVSSGGVYTPPTSLTGGSTATLTATAAEDANVHATLVINLISAGSDGHARIDAGFNSNTTDANGNIWYADPGVEGAIAYSTTLDYPNWRTIDPAAAIYETSAQAYGDLGETIVVPNGNYRLRMMQGRTSNGHCNSGCATWPNIDYQIYAYGPYLYETQGVTKLQAVDPNWFAGYLFQSPVDIYVPAKVTDNVLRTYVRSVENDVAPNYHSSTNSSAKLAYLNGLEIIPDTAAAHWAIDTGWSAAGTPQTQISAGQTFTPFSITDWYTGDVATPTWSILTGPSGASIGSSSGILSLAAGSYLGNQPIVVQATDGTNTATATIKTVGPVPF